MPFVKCCRRRLKSNVTRRTQIKRASAAVVGIATVGAIFAIALGPDITLGGFTRSPIPPAQVNVDAGPGTVTCNIALTATSAIEDAGCTFVSPGGVERGCSTAQHTGTSTDGVWSCDVTLPPRSEGGTWNLARVFARRTAALAIKVNVTGDEIVAAGDVTGESGPISSVTELQVTVSAGAPDTTPPTVSATLATPDNFYRAFGGDVTCTNTVTDANSITEVGCSIFEPGAPVSKYSCASTTPVSGNDYECTLNIPPGEPLGTWAVSAFARDEAGNRANYPLNEIVTVSGGGFTWDFVASLQTAGKGIPIRVKLDANGDAWINTEFHTSGFAKIVDATLTEDTARTIPSQETIFAHDDGADTITQLAEGLEVDSEGFVWFTEGGAQWEDTLPNHSRVGRYDPVLNTFRMYNLPGSRNVVEGIWIDESKSPKWIWVVEGGTNSDFIVQTPWHQGSLLAFREDAAWQNVLSSANWAATTDPELCTGVETALDGCFQRFDLPAATWFGDPYPPTVGAFWPAHIVGDVNGDIWFTNFQGTSIGRLVPSTEATYIYPSGTPRAGWALGSGPWDIAISPDGSRVAFTAYADATIIGFDWARRNDAACLSLDGDGDNPCMTEIVPDLDTTWQNTHSLVYDGCGSLWFTTGFERTGGDPRALEFGNVFSTIGFVNPGWTHATLLEPTAFTPNPNPAGDIAYHGIDFNPATGQLWTIQGPTGEPTKYGVKRWTPLSTRCVP